MKIDKIESHICSKNTCFQEGTKHTKIDIMPLSFWLHVGTHRTFEMRYCMNIWYKGVWSYDIRSLVGNLKKQNLEVRCLDDSDVHGLGWLGYEVDNISFLW